MARPVGNLRMFVAIRPPPEHVERLLAQMEALDLPPHRTTPIEQVHLTLLFIGDVPTHALDATIESVQRAAAGLPGFRLAPQRLITLPRRGPSRLVAAETDAPPTLLELHRRLVTRLASSPRERTGDRYTPHLTLCRFRSSAEDVRIDQPIVKEPFDAARIVLMRSTLRPSGAEHHEVASAALGGSESSAP
jgi:2'-5' RNA ligase